MSRFHQFLFLAAIVALSWFAMQAVHELGHVLGAVATGGGVTRIVLHPLTISRTDVSPNPHPGIVVWAGPVVGCVLPLAIAAMTPRRAAALRTTLQFFAGFCLVANGGYIGYGSFEGIGDCGDMLRTGTPRWAMQVFGVAAMVCGLFLWHRLGKLRAMLGKKSS